MKKFIATALLFVSLGAAPLSTAFADTNESSNVYANIIEGDETDTDTPSKGESSPADSNANSNITGEILSDDEVAEKKAKDNAGNTGYIETDSHENYLLTFSGFGIIAFMMGYLFAKGTNKKEA